MSKLSIGLWILSAFSSSSSFIYFFINFASLSNFCDCKQGLKIRSGYGSAQTEAEHCQFQKFTFSS